MESSARTLRFRQRCRVLGSLIGKLFPKLLFGFKLLIGLLLLWLLYKLQLLDVAPMLALMKSPWLLVTCALSLAIGYLLMALRWQLLLQAQKINVSFRDAFRISYASAFLGLYLPGTIGGDIVRAALGIAVTRTQAAGLVLSIVADRIVGLLSVLILGLLASAFYLFSLDSKSMQQAQLQNMVLWMGGVFVVGIVAIFAAGFLSAGLHKHTVKYAWLGRGALVRLIAQIAEALHSYWREPRILLRALCVSIVAQSFGLTVLALLAWGIDLGGLGFSKFFIAGALAALAITVPLTPSGLGVGEMTFAQIVLWLEPSTAAPAYATIFLAKRAIMALVLLPALLVLPTLRERR